MGHKTHPKTKHMLNICAGLAVLVVLAIIIYPLLGVLPRANFNERIGKAVHPYMSAVKTCIKNNDWNKLACSAKQNGIPADKWSLLGYIQRIQVVDGVIHVSTQSRDGGFSNHFYIPSKMRVGWVQTHPNNRHEIMWTIVRSHDCNDTSRKRLQSLCKMFDIN